MTAQAAPAAGRRTAVICPPDCAPPHPRTQPSAEWVDPDTGLERWGRDWLRLALTVDRATCATHPDYFRAWRRTLAEDVDSAVLVARRGDDVCGILPVMRARVRRGPACAPRHDFAPSDRLLLPPGRPRPFRLRQISPVVSIPAAIVAPMTLWRAEDGSDVTAAFAPVLAGRPDWDVIVIPAYAGPEQAAWCDAFSALGLRPRVQRLDRHIQSLAAVRPFEDLVERQNRNFRRNVRRALTAAHACGMAIDLHQGDAAVDRLDILARVARRSWKTAGRDGADVQLAYEGRQQRFVEDLLASGLSGAHPIMAVAAVAGDPVAVLLSVRHGGSLTTLLTFRDNRFPATSPGLLLLGRTIDHAARTGVAWVDLNATHEWVRHLADLRRSANNVVVFAPTMRGRLFALVADAAASRR